MGLKQRCSIVLIGIMKAVEGLAIFGLICAAISLSADAQTVIATVAVGTNPSGRGGEPDHEQDLRRERSSRQRTQYRDGD